MGKSFSHFKRTNGGSPRREKKACLPTGVMETIGSFRITCKVENVHREGKAVYLGVFDLNQRLEQTRKVLREKQHLKKLIEEDIRDLEKDIQDLEAMTNNKTLATSVKG